MRFLPVVLAATLLLVGMAVGPVTDARGASEENNSVQPSAYSTVVVRPSNTVDFDLAKWQAQARIVSVSSGALAFSVRLIDNDPQTSFRFSSDDLHPTVVVELSGQEPIHRVSAIFQADENATLDVYLLSQLPKNLGRLDGAPIACSVNPNHPNESAADFAATNARYVVFRWTRKKPTHTPFSVAEVNAFSSVRAEQIPPTFAENDIHFVNETKIDFSNKLGTLADPPSVNVVSP